MRNEMTGLTDQQLQVLNYTVGMLWKFGLLEDVEQMENIKHLIINQVYRNIDRDNLKLIQNWEYSNVEFKRD